MTTVHYRYSLTFDADTTDISVRSALGLDDDMLRPWYSTLKNVFGHDSTNYDGYFQSVELSNQSLKLHCYLVKDMYKFNSYALRQGPNWENDLRDHIGNLIFERLTHIHPNLRARSIVSELNVF